MKYTIIIERWKHNGNFGTYYGQFPETREITGNTLKECMSQVNAARLENDMSIFYSWQIADVRSNEE